MYESQASVPEMHRTTQMPAVSLGSVGIDASEDVRRLADWGCSPTVGESPTTLAIGSALVRIYVYEKFVVTTRTSATAQVSQWWNWKRQKSLSLVTEVARRQLVR